MLEDVKSLHDLGFALHCLKPKSKMPIESRWSQGPRKTWKELRHSYKKGMNIGVRLGRASKLADGSYLGVIDCDVKSTDVKDQREMFKALSKVVGSEGAVCISGRGNGSQHLYIKSEKPLKPMRITQSPNKVKVLMPSIERTSKYEKETLSEKEIKAGWRIRPAWEISVMGEGQQVVLPPSIHPDSGRAYKWGLEISNLEDLPTFEGAAKEDVTYDESADIEINDVDLAKTKLPDHIVNMITTGDGVDDRSSALFKVVGVMVNQGFDDSKIVSILTDKAHYLGEVAYTHAQTRNRKRAGEWLLKYTIAKVRATMSAKAAFEEIAKIDDSEVKPKPSKKKIKVKTDITSNESQEWRDKIKRSKEKKILNTFANVKLILTEYMKEECGGPYLARDQFALRDCWLVDCPWGSKKDEPVRDDDKLLIKEWLAEHFSGFEPATNLIEEVLITHAVANGFHPVKNFLKELPEWDGVERLDNWLITYLNAEGPEHYLSTVGRITLVAAIARIFKPGCKYDHVLILEGEQGVGKSTAVDILGSPWYSDAHLNPSDKDAVVNIQGVWFYELGELSSLNKSEVDFIKAYITRRVDRIRLPYGERREELPRQGIFIGTTNREGYLKDVTGNRRFWPVSIGAVRMKALKNDRAQLFAEAVVAYELGQELYIERGSDVERLVKIEQAKRLGITFLDEAVVDFFLNPPKDFNTKAFRLSDLAVAMLDGGSPHLTNTNPATQYALAEALKKSHFECRQRRYEGKRGRYWSKRELQDDVSE